MTQLLPFLDDEFMFLYADFERLTARELRSGGSGASLDVREDSMPAMTFLPGA
jgi:hypothetical protein